MTTVNVSRGDTTVVTVTTEGPQGPAGGLVVNTSATIDKSVVYYDAAAAVFKADNIWTTSTLSDGGNF